MNKDLETRAEVAMMGYIVPVNSFEEANEMTSYIYKVARNAEKTFNSGNRVNRYNSSKTKNEIVGLVAYRAYGMPIVAYILQNKSKGDYKIVPYEQKSEDGKYAYTFVWAENLDCPEFSELGDICVKQVSGGTYKYCG